MLWFQKSNLVLSRETSSQQNDLLRFTDELSRSLQEKRQKAMSKKSKKKDGRPLGPQSQSSIGFLEDMVQVSTRAHARTHTHTHTHTHTESLLHSEEDVTARKLLLVVMQYKCPPPLPKLPSPAQASPPSTPTPS